MKTVSVICFIIAFLIIISSLRKNADIFSPARVFGLLWSIIIGLAELKFSGFQHNWSSLAWITLIISISAFMVGVYSIYIITLNQSLYKIERIREILKSSSLNKSRKIFVSILIIFFVYITAYVIEVSIAGFVPMFSPTPDKARMAFGVFGLHLLVTLAPTLLIIISVFLIIPKNTRRLKIFALIIFAITFFTYSLLLQRFIFIMCIIISIVIIHYFSKHINLRNILVFSIVAVLILFLIQSVRLIAYAQNYIYLVSQMKYPIEYAIFTEPYMYIVMNLENFARGIDKLTNFTYGYYTIEPIFALTGLKHWLSDYLNLVERPFLISGYNTFPFQWTYYRDFGILGMTFICYILGAIIGIFYYNFRLKPNFFKMVIYAISVFFISISFFTNILTMLNMVFNIIVLLTINYILFRNNENLN